MKKTFTVFFISIILIGACGCGEKVKEATLAPAQSPVTKTATVDYKHAKKFVDPIIIQDHKETDGYFYNFNDDYNDEYNFFHMTGDNMHFIVAAGRYKDKGYEHWIDNVICKIDLNGRVEWSWPTPKKFDVYDMTIKSDGIYALLQDNYETKYLFIKVNFDGALLYKKLIFDDENDSSYIRSAFCDDGIIFMRERSIEPENDDFMINEAVMKKFDFEGNKVWTKHHSSDAISSGGELFLHKNDIFYAYKDIVFKENARIQLQPNLVLPGRRKKETYTMHSEIAMKYPSDIPFAKIAQTDFVYNNVFIKISQNGYPEWEKRIVTEDDTGSICFNKNGLFSSSHTKANSLYQNILRQYNFSGDLIWEGKYVFGKEDWYIDHFQSLGDSIWGNAYCDDEDDNTKQYMCHYAMNGELINIYQIRDTDTLIGWTGNKAVLYREIDWEE